MTTPPDSGPVPQATPADAARRLAEELTDFVFHAYVTDLRNDGSYEVHLDAKGTASFDADLQKSFAAILLPTLTSHAEEVERLTRERDALLDDMERPFRVTGAMYKVLAEAGCISVDRQQYESMKAERHDFQMRAERAEAILRKAGRALTGGKHVTYEDLDEYLRTVEKERDAALRSIGEASGHYSSLNDAYQQLAVEHGKLMTDAEALRAQLTTARALVDELEGALKNYVNHEEWDGAFEDEAIAALARVAEWRMKG